LLSRFTVTFYRWQAKATNAFATPPDVLLLPSLYNLLYH
jgi:hypothetical protein